jgi:ribose 5-phosphate isomerase B
MRISLAADELTGVAPLIAGALAERGHETILHGALGEKERADWAWSSEAAARDVFEGRAEQAIVCCWTGTGASIAANKVPGVRAALCIDAFSADGARRWNDANALALSLRTTSQALLGEILDAWFAAAPSAIPQDAANVAHVAAITTDAGAILPELAVSDGRAAVAFYESALGAVERHRVGGTDEEPSLVSCLTVAGASFWVHDESPEHGLHSPQSMGGASARMLLVVADPTALHARAVLNGAHEATRVRREHGWLVGRIEDPFGHHWEIGRPLA